MLDNLVFSLNVVLPLFLCCVVGYFSRQKRLVDEAFISGCSHVVFYLAIPANIFLSIAGSDLQEAIDLSLMAYVLGAIVVAGVLLTAIVPRLIKDRAIAATMTICMYRSNFAMLGIPLAASLMGTQGAIPTMVMVPFATLFYTVFTVLILVVVGQGKNASPRAAAKNAAREVLRNPLILASAASILVSWFHIPLPTILESTIRYFANMCTGLSLFMLGAQLDMREMKERLRYTVPVVFVRLILVPLIVVVMGALLGFRDGELGCIFIIFAAPTAVNCYILASRMGGDGKLAGDAVLASSCISSVTLTIGIFILKTLRLL